MLLHSPWIRTTIRMLVTAIVVFALQPAAGLELDRCEPFILKRGATARCTLHGNGLGDSRPPVRVWTDFPARVEQVEAAGADAIRVWITVEDSAPTGPSVLRVYSRHGLSDPTQVWIDDFPELSPERLDPENGLASPEPPFVVSATITRDEGFTGSFALTSPGHQTIQALTRRLGWEGDLVGTLEDEDGKALITVDDGEGSAGDAGFTYHCSKPGVYRVRIRDVEYGVDLPFLLRAGSFPLVRCSGPPNAAAPESSSLTIFAENGALSVALTQTSPRPPRHGFLQLPVPLPRKLGSALSPTRIVSPLPLVVLDADRSGRFAVDLPCSVAGRLGSEPVRIRFKASGGQRLHVRPFSRSIGGTAFPALDLSDSAGKVLATSGRNDDAEEILRHRIPQEGDYELSIRDLLGGSPHAIYHLLIRLDAAPVILRLPTDKESPLDRFNVIAAGVIPLQLELERLDYEGPVAIRVFDDAGHPFETLDSGFEKAQNRTVIRVLAPEEAKPGSIIHLDVEAVVRLDGHDLFAPLDTEGHRLARLGPSRLSPALVGRVAVAVIDPPILIATAEPGTDELVAASVSGDRAGAPSFSRDVAPILELHCVTCHGPEKQRGKYRLDTFSGLTTPGSSGETPVAARDPEASALFLRLTTTDADDRMPADGDPLSQNAIDTIRAWIETGAVFDSPDPNAPLTAVAPLPPHPAPPETYPTPVPITALAFAPDGAVIYTSGYREILVWDSATGTLRQRLKGLPSRILDLSVHPQGDRIAAAGGDPGRHGEARVLQLPGGETETVVARASDVLLAARFSPDGSALATGGANNLLEIYQVADWRLRHAWAHHADWITTVAWSDDGSLLASGSRDRSIKVYGVEEGIRVSNLTGHQKAIAGLAFAPDGQRLFSIALDTTFRQWNLEDDSSIGKPASWNHDPQKLVRSSSTLLAALSNGTLALRDLVSAEQTQSWPVHEDAVVSCAVHEPAGLAAAGSMDGRVALVDLSAGEVRLRFTAVP
ncbi:MAG TPA: c-type cytochrome domain-containing protein [Verrucomicrobiales bacterium]|nr:c-type cytochrome domain-containing protein [Verrucomicrobiales bacterium]